MIMSPLMGFGSYGLRSAKALNVFWREAQARRKNPLGVLTEQRWT
jgi:hypothetical protein